MTAVAFVLGVPGVGKSTLVRHLLGSPVTERAEWTLGEAFAALGRYDGRRYDGPDSMPPRADFVSRALDRMEVIVGDRIILLDGTRFVDAGAALLQVVLARHGERRMFAFHLITSTRIVQWRRAERESPNMSAAWVDRERDKCVHAGKIVSAAGGTVVELDAADPPEIIADEVGHVLTGGMT